MPTKPLTRSKPPVPIDLDGSDTELRPATVLKAVPTTPRAPPGDTGDDSTSGVGGFSTTEASAGVLDSDRVPDEVDEDDHAPATDISGNDVPTGASQNREDEQSDNDMKTPPPRKRPTSLRSPPSATDEVIATPKRARHGSATPHGGPSASLRSSLPPRASSTPASPLPPRGVTSTAAFPLIGPGPRTRSGARAQLNRAASTHPALEDIPSSDVEHESPTFNG